MPELFPLADLRDPIGFLRGARIPVHSTSGNHIEIVGDAALIWDPTTLMHGSLPLAHGAWERWSLDPSDPDVARWCDRKIAEALGLPTDDGARLRPPRVNPELGWLLICGLGYPLLPSSGIRKHLRPALAGIPCDEAHIPAARRALVLALFGKETT